MIRRLALTIAVASALMLAGCGDDQAPAAQAAPVVDAGPTSAAATAPVDPTPTQAAEDQVHKLGTTVRLADVSVTVYRYRPTDLGRGEKGGSVEARTCNIGKAPLEVSSGPWSFLFDDDTVVDSHWSGVREPEYPFNARRLRPGKCVRGWITSTLPDGHKPVSVEYAPKNDDGSTLTTVTWGI